MNSASTAHNNIPTHSFYWFDYETFGANPVWDRPCQFAGVRTDSELNVIGEPLVIYCRQSPDYLPHPEACRVTGITPQLANERGLCEAEFIQRIVNEIGFPGTCSVGYNSIRFDDEFTRHTLFRSLRDPYEQEWKDGNSRWDLLDIVRLTRALRPDGIQWPLNEDGSASNRLEHLSRANDIDHSQAHDAMSDVWATIGMARLIRQKQPKLFEYAFSNRGKAQVSHILNTRQREVCLQVSGMIPGQRHHLSAVLPLTAMPANPNSIVVLDLHEDPDYLASIDSDELARRLFQPAKERSGNDQPRPGLRTVQINKCPVLVPLKTLRQQDASRLNIDLNTVEQHALTARALLNDSVLNTVITAMTREWQDVADRDVDGSLYGGSFLSQSDKHRLSKIQQLEPLQMQSHGGHFDDQRLNEMLWRYQARNYPESLDAEQKLRWLEHCQGRLGDDSAPWLSLDEYRKLVSETSWTTEEKSLQQALVEYGQSISRQLALES